MTTNPAPRVYRDRDLEAQVFNRVTKEAEAALGGRAMPVMVDDLALYLMYDLKGMLTMGGKIPKHQVPAALRMIADTLEANA